MEEQRNLGRAHYQCEIKHNTNREVLKEQMPVCKDLWSVCICCSLSLTLPIIAYLIVLIFKRSEIYHLLIIITYNNCFLLPNFFAVKLYQCLMYFKNFWQTHFVFVCYILHSTYLTHTKHYCK